MKKLMFKLTVYLFIIASLVMTYPIETSASTSFNNYDIETLENGYYYETIIEEKESPNTIIPTGAVKYITKTKTTSMKNSNGELLWSLSIEATFSYNGS